LFAKRTKTLVNKRKPARKIIRGPDDPKPPKVASGWDNWLKKLASEVPRTEESWQEIRYSRRKGEIWIDNLIAEYGRLPSRGIPGQVGSSVSQELLDAKRKELEEQGIDYTSTGPRGETKRYVQEEDAPVRKRQKRASMPAGRTLEGRKSGESEAEGEGAAQARKKAKEEAIAKRNGAPRGWVYVAFCVPPARAVNAVPENLPPRRERSRTISYGGLC
jgi:hypothetical protein